MIKTSEARLQQECFMHHWNTYPQYRGMFFKIKNEGTNRITGSRDKATGLVAGVADSCLLLPFALGPVFIEFKTEKGRQSPSQIAWMTLIEKYGHKYFTVRSLEDFKKICDKYYSKLL